MVKTYDITQPSVQVPMIGRGARRYEARAKVTGETAYAADEPLAGTLHASLVTVPEAKGTITSIDAIAAEAVPGVRLVLTYENVGVVPDLRPLVLGGPMQSSFYPLSNREVRYAGQIVGMVVAETIEAARRAAELVRVEVDAAGSAVAHMHHDGAPEPETLPVEVYEPAIVGDVDAAFAEADASVEQEYRTPIQHHNPIELWFTSAEWRESKLVAYVPSQWLTGTRSALAETFGLPTEQVRVVSKFVGGAFGAKAAVLAHTIMVADAARQLNAPVKLYLTRTQMFTAGVYRPASTNRIRVAVKGGRLSAIDHTHIGQTSRYDVYADTGTEQTARLYDWSATRTAEQIVRVDTNTPGFMRAPAEVPSVFALECAIDEVAYSTGLDPVELRLASDSEREPVRQLPWTSRSLAECLRRGSEVFAWKDRPREAGVQRRGDWLFGQGMASALYPTFVNAGTAELRLASDLSARVSAAAHDLGTGAYTIAQQIVASELGIPMDGVRVEMGDSDLPANGMAGGSAQTASVCSAILDACRKVRARLVEAATASTGALAGLSEAGITFADGNMRAEGRTVRIADVFDGIMFGVIEERGFWRPEPVSVDTTRELYRRGQGGYQGFALKEVIQAAFGAQFAEVAVHRLTGEVRVPRIAGAFAAGRIMNERTARSQLMGGMIWGVGAALHEATEVDHRYARFANADLGEYPIVVNADVPQVTVELVEEVDNIVNPLGVKGIGELGIVGMNAAIANAVFHATGRRIRDLPIYMEKLL